MPGTVRAPAARPSGEALASISRGMVRLHKSLYGKGPTHVRAYGFDDLVVVVIRDFYTDGERTLREHGESAAVARQRRAVSEVGAADARRLVEMELRRGVESYQSSVDPASGAQVEVFLLESADAGVSARKAAPISQLVAQAARAQEANRRVLDEHRALRGEQVQSRAALRHTRERHDKGRS